MTQSVAPRPLLYIKDKDVRQIWTREKIPELGTILPDGSFVKNSRIYPIKRPSLFLVRNSGALMTLIDAQGNKYLLEDLNYLKEFPAGTVFPQSINLAGAGVKRLPDNLCVLHNLNLSQSDVTELPRNLRVGKMLSLSKSLITKLAPDMHVHELNLVNSKIRSIDSSVQSIHTLRIDSSITVTAPFSCDRLQFYGNVGTYFDMSKFQVSNISMHIRRNCIITNLNTEFAEIYYSNTSLRIEVTDSQFGKLIVYDYVHKDRFSFTLSSCAGKKLLFDLNFHFKQIDLSIEGQIDQVALRTFESTQCGIVEVSNLWLDGSLILEGAQGFSLSLPEQGLVYGDIITKEPVPKTFCCLGSISILEP